MEVLDSPKKPKSVSRKLRLEVFRRQDGLCAYCGEALPEKGFHIDHIEPQSLRFYHYGKDVHRSENLHASCRSCNILKGSHSLEGFRYLVGEFYRTLRRDSRYRCLLRFNRITETHVDKDVLFHFEKPTTTK